MQTIDGTGVDAAGPGGDEFPAISWPAGGIRVVLTASAVVLVLILALPVLASFTSVLDGVVGGIGVAYVVGFGEFVFAMAGAVAYCRWVNRLEDDPDQPDGELT